MNTPVHDPRSRSGIAFSLIEMLVVIAIIAILAGLILPALARAKGKAQGVASLNNSKQWGYAMHMYIDDNNDVFPYEGNAGSPIDAGKNLEAWYNVVPPLARMQPLKDMYADGKPPLPGSRNIFTCPGVKKDPGYPPTMAKPFFMYGFNNRLDPNDNPPPAPEQRFRLSQVVKPVETVIFTEAGETNFPSTSGRYTPARHSYRANLAFVDGHAEAIRTNEYRRNETEDNSSNAEWSKPRRVYWYPFQGAPSGPN